MLALARNPGLWRPLTVSVAGLPPTWGAAAGTALRRRCNEELMLYS